MLRRLATCDPQIDRIRASLPVNEGWFDSELEAKRALLAKFDYKVDIARMDLAELRSFLRGKRDFSLRLLENPTLLEHESFTNLQMAVFHLTEEMEHRHTLDELPASDYEHLGGDISRVYAALVEQWLIYLGHLRNHYPYLYSLATRNNPFKPAPSVIVTSAQGD